MIGEDDVPKDSDVGFVESSVFSDSVEEGINSYVQVAPMNSASVFVDQAVVLSSLSSTELGDVDPEVLGMGHSGCLVDIGDSFSPRADL